PSDNVGIDVVGNYPLDEHDDQNQDDRRDIEAAQIGHELSDRRQRRLGDPVQELGHRRDELVARVHDIEGDQPGQDGRSDQKPDVEVKDDNDDIEDSAHVVGAREEGVSARYRFIPPQTREVPGKMTPKSMLSPFLTWPWAGL